MAKQVKRSGHAAALTAKGKAMKKYRVTFEVVQTQLDVIVGLLGNDVTNMHIEEIGKANNTYSTDWAAEPAKKLLAAMAAGKEYHYLDPHLAKTLKDIGYAPRSISGVIAWLVERGKLKRTRRGHYVK